VDFTGVSDRTVRRDILALEEAGFPIETIDSKDQSDRKSQIFKLQNNMKIGKSLILTPGELLALYFARGAVAPLKKTPFYSDLTAMFEKVRALIDPKGQRALDEITEEFFFEPTPKWSLGIEPELLETVRAACAEGQILKAQYDSGKGQKKARKLGPHFLYFAKGSLYLVAEDLADKVVKIFAMPRFRQAEMTEEVYSAPKVDPKKFFESSFGMFHSVKSTEVVIRFEEPVAPYVQERRWHPSQAITVLEDGAIQLKLLVGLTPDLVQWILGFGSAAEVQKPESLRDQISQTALQVAGKYRNTKAA
jgi:predicted DNA-binding transcriptional regulator YafY